MITSSYEGQNTISISTIELLFYKEPFPSIYSGDRNYMCCAIRDNAVQWTLISIYFMFSNLMFFNYSFEKKKEFIMLICVKSHFQRKLTETDPKLYKCYHFYTETGNNTKQWLMSGCGQDIFSR